MGPFLIMIQIEINNCRCLYQMNRNGFEGWFSLHTQNTWHELEKKSETFETKFSLFISIRWGFHQVRAKSITYCNFFITKWEKTKDKLPDSMILWIFTWTCHTQLKPHICPINDVFPKLKPNYNSTPPQQGFNRGKKKRM